MMKILREILLITSLFFTTLLVAQDIPEPMYPPRLVNDFSGIFSDSERNDLEQMLRNYNDTTSTQIYVVTIDNLTGYSASDYAFKLGEKWGIGQKGKNNGAVILIKPKRKNSRGDVFIAVGYGLEEKLNDARIGRIIDNYMIPYFQQSDYYSGARAAVQAMINYLSGQFQADEDSGEGDDNSELYIIIIILMIIFINYLLNKNGGNNRGNGSSGRGGGFPIIIGGGRSGSGSFGGGRGFGGGGGGGFGGGGAGRSW